MCEMHPSAWSCYAFLICAVAAAWKCKNEKPQPKASLPTLAALAGVQVVKGKFQKFFDLKNVSNGKLTRIFSSTEMEVDDDEDDDEEKPEAKKQKMNGTFK